MESSDYTRATVSSNGGTCDFPCDTWVTPSGHGLDRQRASHIRNECAGDMGRASTVTRPG